MSKNKQIHSQKNNLLKATKIYIDTILKSTSNPSLQFSSSIYFIQSNPNYHYCDHSILQYIAKQSTKISHNIQNINLSGCNIGDKGLRQLTRSNLPMLSILNLNKNKITPTGIKYLTSVNYKNLKQLNLQNNAIKNDGLQILCQGKWFNLQILILNYCNIYGSGSKYLNKVNWLNLKILNLKSNNIDNVGAVYLTKCKFQQLKQLNLDNNILTNYSMKAFIKASWNNIQILKLGGNFIQDQAMLILSLCNWKELKCLELSAGSLIYSRLQTNLSMGGIKQLIKSKFQQIILTIYKPQCKQIFKLLIYNQVMSQLLKKKVIRQYDFV